MLIARLLIILGSCAGPAIVQFVDNVELEIGSILQSLVPI